MQLSEEQIQTLVDQSLPSIIDGFKKEISGRISWEVTEGAAKQVREHVTEWIKANVFPELEKAMVEAKEGLISAGVLASKLMAEELAAAMHVQLKANLNQSWGRQEIFKAMFK